MLGRGTCIARLVTCCTTYLACSYLTLAYFAVEEVWRESSGQEVKEADLVDWSPVNFLAIKN